MKDKLQGLAFIVILGIGMTVAGWLSDYAADKPILGVIVFLAFGVSFTALISKIIKGRK